MEIGSALPTPNGIIPRRNEEMCDTVTERDQFVTDEHFQKFQCLKACEK